MNRSCGYIRTIAGERSFSDPFAIRTKTEWTAISSTRGVCDLRCGFYISLKFHPTYNLWVTVLPQFLRTLGTRTDPRTRGSCGLKDI